MKTLPDLLKENSEILAAILLEQKKTNELLTCLCKLNAARVPPPPLVQPHRNTLCQSIQRIDQVDDLLFSGK